MDEREETMTFKLYINADNAAFDPPQPELARILRGIADRIDNGLEMRQFQTIHDGNGNPVGQFALKEV